MKINKSLVTKVASYLTLTAAALVISPAQAGTKDTYTLAKGSHANSVSHKYHVYTPTGYDNVTALPMVFALHGCKQDDETVFNEFGWQDTADANNFILVAPFSNADATPQYGFQNCWRYWYDEHQDRGDGLNQDLINIAQKVEADYKVNADRRYITGLSSGAFMTTIAAATYNDYWTAAIPMAGGGYRETASTANTGASCVSYGENGSYLPVSTLVTSLQNARAASPSDYNTPIMFMNSRYDCTVGIQGGISGTESFAQHYGATLDNSLTEDCTVTDQTGAIPCANEKYTDAAGNVLVESYFYDGPSSHNPRGDFHATEESKGHYLSGAKANGKWSKTFGQDAREAAWAFFSRYDRNGDVLPPPPPTGNECPAINGTLDEHEAASRAYKVGTTSFCATHTDSTYNLVQAGKAVVCNSWYACASDGVQLGLNNTYTQATVYESPVGVYTTTACSNGSGIEYFAQGSDDLLGTNGSASAKLFEISAGSYSKTDPKNCGNDAPVVTMLGANPLNVDINTVFTDPGATATDTEDGDISVSIVVTGSVNTSVAGPYELTYTATDSELLAGTAVRTVNVIDNTVVNIPVITLLGANPQTIIIGDGQQDPGYSASDVEDGTVPVNVSGNVDTTTPGTYTLYYNAQDSDGNHGVQVTRTVIVEAAPSTSCVTDTVGNHLGAGRVYTFGGYNCKTVGGEEQVNSITYTCEYLETYGGNPTYSIEEISSGVFNKVASCQ